MVMADSLESGPGSKGDGMETWEIVSLEPALG